MAYYNYRAIDESSNIVEGKILASDENALEELLTSKGLTLIEAAKSTFSLSFRGLKPRLRDKDLLPERHTLFRRAYFERPAGHVSAICEQEAVTGGFLSPVTA